MSGVNHLDPKNYEVDEVGHRIARIKLLFVERTVVAVLLYHEPLGIRDAPVAYNAGTRLSGWMLFCNSQEFGQ